MQSCVCQHDLRPQKTNHSCFIAFCADAKALDGTFSQLLERNRLLLVILVLVRHEILLLCHRGKLCAFTLALLLPLLRQRLWQEPERDAGQQDQGAGHYEAQPPGPHPAGVLIVDGNSVWERKDEQRRQIHEVFIGLFSS